MPADPRLLPHPAVIAEAERLAREAHDARRAWLRNCADRYVAAMSLTSWEHMEDIVQGSLVGAHAAILADASRPAARDWMARRIAGAIGWDHWRVSRAADGSEPEEWRALMDACGVPERERRLASAAALTLVFLAVVR